MVNNPQENWCHQMPDFKYKVHKIRFSLGLCKLFIIKIKKLDDNLQIQFHKHCEMQQ